MNLTKLFTKGEKVQMETLSGDEEPTSSDDYLVNKASSFYPKQSKVILGQLVNKMIDGISANDFRDIIASEPEDLKEGEVLRIGSKK